MDYLAGFFIHSHFSLIPLLTNDFLSFTVILLLHAMSVSFCAYREKLECLKKESEKNYKYIQTTSKPQMIKGRAPVYSLKNRIIFYYNLHRVRSTTVDLFSLYQV